jgi:hypothetical protein
MQRISALEADTRPVLQTPLRFAAIVLSLIVALGFILFVTDDASRASNEQIAHVAEYEQADPTPAGEREREKRNSSAHEWVDDANDVLLKPFAGLTDSDSRWVQRGVPALLGLLVYGFLLGYLSRFAKGHG